jgi:hypothetical protein
VSKKLLAAISGLVVNLTGSSTTTGTIGAAGTASFLLQAKKANKNKTSIPFFILINLK